MSDDCLMFSDKREEASPLSSRGRGRAPMPPPPQQHSMPPHPATTQHHPELSPHLSPQMMPPGATTGQAAAAAHNFQRFSDVSEVVGPAPKKKGCCAIL